MSKGIWWIRDNITKIPENAWEKLLQSAAAHYILIFTAVIKDPSLTYWKPYFFFFFIIFTALKWPLHFFWIPPWREVCSESKRAADFGDLNFLRGLRTSSYIPAVCPYWLSFSAQRKRNKEGSARPDLTGCGIAICRGGHLATYKWWGGSKIPIPRSLVAAGYCFVKKEKKGAWHNWACKCVWWSWVSSDGEEGRDRLHHFLKSFFIYISFLAVNLMCKKILNYHHFWD